MLLHQIEHNIACKSKYQAHCFSYITFFHLFFISILKTTYFPLSFCSFDSALYESFIFFNEIKSPTFTVRINKYSSPVLYIILSHIVYYEPVYYPS